MRIAAIVDLFKKLIYLPFFVDALTPKILAMSLSRLNLFYRLTWNYLIS